MKRIIPIWLVIVFLCSIVGASVLPSIVAINNQQNQIKIGIGDTMQAGKTTNTPYTGRVRVYVVEPVSRWTNQYAGGVPYHFGFLGFALNEVISIDPQNTYHKSVTWAGDITESNAMVIAVVFNSEAHQGYAYPPSSNPFTAYYNDATAAATPGNTGYNTVTSTFTHTVFAEEATATWCQYCPDMATKLNNVYESHSYPFYFVALVGDMNSQAYSHLVSDYNFYGYPTGFFDGGYKVILGSGVAESTYRSYIQTCGARAVPDLNLSVSVTYIGSGDLQIGVNITNGAAPNSPPDTPQAPAGETNGDQGTQYRYTTATNDPNNDNVWYWFDWADGSNSGWVGPYNSGTEGNASHTWSETGIYEIKVKAKDATGAESNWSATTPVNITGPTIGLGGIAGGLKKISATITNIGASELTNITWEITVKGGLLGLINIQSTGIINTLAVGNETSVKTDKNIFGLGKIDITVTANEATLTGKGVVFGPFISIK
jgi:hypothetical protein